MSILSNVLQQLDKHHIAEHIAKKHDEARNYYALRTIKATNFKEFMRLIADYYNYHYINCFSSGKGRIPEEIAYGRAREIIESEYLRRDLDWSHAVADAMHGTNGGLRRLVDIISESLKQQAVEGYLQYVLAQNIDHIDFDEKLIVVRELISRIGEDSAYIDAKNPERYVGNLDELIRAYVESLKFQSDIFKRL